MKKSPQEKKLEDMLKSCKFSSSGFLGTDTRNLWEIIDQDATIVARSGKTMEEVAARMQYISNIGAEGLGDWVEVGGKLRVMVDDNRGFLPCPWPHHVRCLKRITTVINSETNTSVRWSELNIHLVKEHGFFEGLGSPFRIDPAVLIKTIFVNQ